MIFWLAACCALPADIRPWMKQPFLAMPAGTSFPEHLLILNMESGKEM